MDRRPYSDYIENAQSEETKKIIGEIDVDFLKSNKPESLNYSLPLIERMVLEIFKLVPDSDVEYYSQGTMNPIMEIIDKNNNSGILPDNLLKIINYYFGKDGIRNIIFHPNDEEIQIKVNFEEINYLILTLLIILNELIKIYSEFDYKSIEYIN